MKKSVLILVVGCSFFSCKKEQQVRTTPVSVTLKTDGQKFQFFHNGVAVSDTIGSFRDVVFPAMQGDSVRIYSEEQLPQSHTSTITVDGNIVQGHYGFQDTCNIYYVVN